MRHIFLTLSIFLTSFVFTTINAQNVKLNQKHPIVRVKGPNLPYYRASDQSEVVLNGASDAPFTKLAFTKFKHKNLDGITPKEHNTVFEVEKGSYQINFTGTFLSVSDDQDGINTIVFGIQAGSKFYDLNTDMIELSTYDNYHTLSFSDLLHFDEKTKVSIVVKNIQPTGIATISQRIVSLTKLS